MPTDPKVATTMPDFHDGSAATLQDAVAQVHSAASNTLDIAGSLKHDSAGEHLTGLENLDIQTLLFMATGYHDSNIPMSTRRRSISGRSIRPDHIKSAAGGKRDGGRKSRAILLTGA